MSLSLPLALLLAAPLSLQEPAQAPSPEEALDRAIAAQLTDGRAIRVEHFGIELNLRERGETPREVDVTVLYDYRKGGRLQLVLDDSERGGVTVEKGYDGEHYWLREKGQPQLSLAGREYAKDRELIDDTLDLCEELLLLFDLERLKARARELSVSEGSIARRSEAAPHWVLQGSMLLQDHPRAFALWLDATTWLPSRLSVESDPEGRAEGEAGAGDGDAEPAAPVLDQEFDLSAYSDFSVLGSEELMQGRLLPRSVKEYRRDQDGGRVQVRILELHHVQWRKPPRIDRYTEARDSD